MLLVNKMREEILNKFIVATFILVFIVLMSYLKYIKGSYIGVMTIVFLLLLFLFTTLLPIKYFKLNTEDKKD